MSVILCVSLWAVAGEVAGLAAYEDEVLGLVPDHGGRVVLRVAVVDPGGDGPCETQVIEFGDEAGYAGYLADLRRTRLAHVRDAVIARTHLQRVRPVVTS